MVLADDLDPREVLELRRLRERLSHGVLHLEVCHGVLAITRFKIGDRVAFQPSGRGEVTGMLTRYNRKTVTVITDDGQQWNVSPRFIRKVARETKPASSQNVIELRKK